MRIAIVGAGISGIAFAGVLTRLGHECVLFEKATRVGGIWALAYPQVRLQNSHEQYTFIDFPWPEPPDQHPTAEQILAYIEGAIDHFGLDVRLQHTVTSMVDTSQGWTLSVDHDGGQEQLEFDYAIVSIGQYAEQKYRPEFSDEDKFRGIVLTERDVETLEIFRDKKVVVVGFGKSAVDMCAFATPSAKSVAHVFRTPRWLVPFRLLGVHYSYLFFARATTFFMPSWVHSGRLEHAVHRSLGFFVRGFWKGIGTLIRSHIRGHADRSDPTSRERLERAIPTHSFARDMRSATAMAPEMYYSMIADGSIEPYHAEVKGFTEDALLLANDEKIPADVVVLSVGSGTPVFPFMPQAYRDLLENHADGVQLYRHLIHPQIPNLAFAGYNHGFMHIPAAEIGALWLGAVLRGDLKLPDSATQMQSIDRIRQWKRQHVTYEPSRSCAVSTRFQQYLDALLMELGVSQYRKMPNIIAECFARYGGPDYAGIVEQVISNPPRESLAVRQFDA